MIRHIGIFFDSLMLNYANFDAADPPALQRISVHPFDSYVYISVFNKRPFLGSRLTSYFISKKLQFIKFLKIDKSPNYYAITAVGH